MSEQEKATHRREVQVLLARAEQALLQAVLHGGDEDVAGRSGELGRAGALALLSSGEAQESLRPCALAPIGWCWFVQTSRKERGVGSALC
jgi:hypothetical protein